MARPRRVLRNSKSRIQFEELLPTSRALLGCNIRTLLLNLLTNCVAPFRTNLEILTVLTICLLLDVILADPINYLVLWYRTSVLGVTVTTKLPSHCQTSSG